jgi:hypothetical protein
MGFSSHSREFKAMIRELVSHSHLPDYTAALEDEAERAQQQVFDGMAASRPDHYA